MKKLIFLIFLTPSLYAQSLDSAIKIPSAPSVFSFEKYGDIPVGLSTGTANVQIPIYTIRHKNFTFPLYLSYHTSGVKVDEYNPDIGLGWNLNFGGIISCNVRGLYDFESASIGTGNQSSMNEIYTHYFNAFAFTGSGGRTGLPLGTGGDLKRDLLPRPAIPMQIIYSRAFEYVKNSYESISDSAPDIFSYFFMDKQGKFMYNNSLEPHTIPYDDIKIDKIYGAMGYEYLLGFKITDINGVQFIFTDLESVESFSITGGGFPLNASFLNNGGPIKNRDWKLSKIILLDGEEINFEYEVIQYSYSSTSRIKNEITPMRTYFPPSYYISGFSTQAQDVVSNFDIAAKRLRRITTSYDNLSINFKYRDTNNTAESIVPMSEIIIKQGVNNIAKYYTNHTYYTSNKRFVLNSVKKEGNPAYEFKYNNIEQFPKQNSFDRDLWGYNYKSYGTLLFEDITIKKVYPGKSRTPSFNSTLIGSLQKIIYPTGGSTEFIYEQNQYFGTEKRKTQKTVGAVSFTDYSEYISSTFTISKDKVGTLNGVIELLNTQTPSGFVPPGTHITLINETTNTTVSRIDLTEDNVIWPYHINEKVFMTPGTYKLIINNYVMNIGGSFNIEYYDVYNYEGNLNAGGLRVKEVVDKTNIDSIAKRKEYIYYNPLTPQKSSGYLPGKIETLISAITYGYFEPGRAHPAHYIHLKRASNSMYNIGNISYQYVTVLEQGRKSTHKFTKFKDIQIEDETGEPTPNISFSWRRNIPLEINYFHNNTVVKQVTYRYKNLGNNSYTYLPFSPNYNSYVNTYRESLLGFNFRLKDRARYRGAADIYQVDSDNYTVVPLYTPTDWIYKNQTIEKQYDTNGLNPIITTTNYFYENDRHLQLTRTETTNSKGEILKTKTYYPDDVTAVSSLGHDNLTTPEKKAIDSLKAQHRIATPIQTESFKNNVLLSTQRSNFKDFGQNANSTGNLILPETVQTSKGTNALEDRIKYHSYYTNGNVKEVSKKDGTHIVYIWGYNEQYPIAKIENATYSQLASYVTNLQTLSNADNDRTIGNVGNEGALRQALNSLRNNPTYKDKWQVTTYTYDPLIGVTSITDPRGQTIYYQYDSFNRLEYVKDAEGKILSKNEYHYKN